MTGVQTCALPISTFHLPSHNSISSVVRPPQLRHLRLAAFNKLSGAVLPLLAALPHLKHIYITGHDRSHGRISGKSLVGLSGFPQLVQLDLYDQSVGEKEGKAMSRMNGGVGVNTGESVGDGYASQMLDDGMSLPSYFSGKVSYQF